MEGGEKLVLETDGKSTRSINMFYEEGHVMASDRNGNRIETPTDLKTDGNCFYERAKQNMGAKTT